MDAFHFHDDVHVVIFAEVQYRCKVPGCSSVIKRPWNHIHQGHKSLSPEEQKLYTELTKSVGVLGPEERREREQRMIIKDDEVVLPTSSFKERPGDTRGMGAFPSEHPVLEDFRK